MSELLDELADYLAKRDKMKFDTLGKHVIPFTAIYSVDNTNPFFEASRSKTDTPTQFLETDPPWVKRGIILNINYRLNPTAAETYTLLVFDAAKANNYESNSRLLYESAAVRVDDTDYLVPVDKKTFNLETTGKIPFNLTWTGAPGVTPGYIRVDGLAYA